MKHTKGPWKYDDTWGLIMAGNEEIAAVHSGIKANAQLIAAAPEMLEQLELVQAYLKAKGESWTGIDSVINKAKGRE